MPMAGLTTEADDLLRRDIARVVVSRDSIARRLDELGQEIAACYRNREPTILGVLAGSLVFMADLVRRLPMKIRLDFVLASSYAGRATKPGKLRLGLPKTAQLAGRDVLIVDDILDTGQTLRAVFDEVRSRRPASLQTCVLIKKRYPQPDTRIDPDFCGFTIEREFVVGYGLDFDNLYRNLSDVCVLKPHVLAGPAGAADAARRGPAIAGGDKA